MFNTSEEGLFQCHIYQFASGGCQCSINLVSSSSPVLQLLPSKTLNTVNRTRAVDSFNRTVCLKKILYNIMHTYLLTQPFMELYTWKAKQKILKSSRFYTNFSFLVLTFFFGITLLDILSTRRAWAVTPIGLQYFGGL